MTYLDLQEIPEFMSCSSYDSESEYILYNNESPMLFEVTDEEPESELHRFIQHENGDENYVTFLKCYAPKHFHKKSEAQIAEELSEIFDRLESWYREEIIDLDNYED